MSVVFFCVLVRELPDWTPTPWDSFGPPGRNRCKKTVGQVSIWRRSGRGLQIVEWQED